MVTEYQLRGSGGPVSDQVIKLGEKEITLGRDLANDVTIPDSEVSRIHARLGWRNERHIVQDMKSTNGTWLNGRPVLAPAALSVGDQLMLGKASVFIYELVPESELDTTREEGDAGDLVTSTMAMPAPQDLAQEARLVMRERSPRAPLSAEQMSRPQASPARMFHARYLAFLRTGDWGGLVAQYSPDATLLSEDRAVAGTDGIREFFGQYFGGTAFAKAEPTGKYVEGRDSILCETLLETVESVARVQDVFVLKDGKATHHFTRTLEIAPVQR